VDAALRAAVRAASEAVRTENDGDALVLALDIGTTGAKAAAVARSGRVRASGGGAPYARGTRSDGAAVEQCPADWLTAAAAATAECVAALPPVRDRFYFGVLFANAIAHTRSVCVCLCAWRARSQGARVVALALSGQMQNVILVDEHGALLRRAAILYSDARAGAEAEEVEALLAASPALRAGTSNLRGAGSVAAKLLWLSRQEPAALRRGARLLLGAHGYVACALTRGRVAACDATTASTTGLLSPRGDAYSHELLAALRLDASLLPRLVRADAPVGLVHLGGAAASAGGDASSPSLRFHDADDDGDIVAAALAAFPRALAGVPLFHGGGDLAATAAGAGADTHLYIGTSGWVARTSPHFTTHRAPDAAAAADAHCATAAPAAATPPSLPPSLFQVAAPCGGGVITAASSLTAGGAVEWCRAALFDGAPAADVSAAAARAPRGAGGVLFLPHLSGERSPFADASARGAFLGIGAATRRDHLARAVLEGVAFNYRALRDALASHTDDVASSSSASSTLSSSSPLLPALPLAVVGGGAASALWVSILADVLACPLAARGGAGAVAARGAAAWALSGLRAWGEAPDGHGVPPPPPFFHAGTDGDADADGAHAVVFPDASGVAAYAALYDEWRRVYPALAAARVQGGGAGVIMAAGEAGGAEA
jgi:xylulokinase